MEYPNLLRSFIDDFVEIVKIEQEENEREVLEGNCFRPVGWSEKQKDGSTYVYLENQRKDDWDTWVTKSNEKELDKLWEMFCKNPQYTYEWLYNKNERKKEWSETVKIAKQFL